ncbi:uncharacterized protein LOC114312533 [Camellia sinensis]|uniref:uncharacterized protein LOC114312533 n=1 Tax=Camellia sinensis TaxID=4442 RepID=UPI001036D960|nr:uncharacterized protein LOC114312533 [Camellia sinensis]
MDSSISQANPLNNHHHKATTATNNNDDYQVADPDLTNMIGRDLNFLKEIMAEIQKFVDHMNVQINQACEKFEELKTRGGGDTNELDQLKMSVKKLKSQIPSKLKIHYDDDSKPHRKPWFDGSINSSSGNNQVDVNKAGNLHSFYNQPQVSFHSLRPESKHFLYIFRIFPEMATMKKRFVIYWWSFLQSGLFSSRCLYRELAEFLANEILDDLNAKGFIEPIYKNCGLVVDSYRMPPYIRSAVTFELELHDFDYFLDLRFACWESCIVNVDAAIIDGRHEIIFKRGTNLKVVYLGRWQNSVTHHIEVPDIKILNFLKNMKELRFLSLRGISLIKELPQFISKLTNLQILDLKACHNLETKLTRSFFEEHDPKLPLSLELPSSLQKLELECFLEIDTPSWLWSGNLKNLKKLYIRGGLLCNLDKIVASTVKMLKLKYLSNLEMPWKDITMLFPNLIYLEKVECPGLNSFPCDQNGVWMRKDNGIDENCGGRRY